MNDSILYTIKTAIGGGAIHEHFDDELVIYINAVVATLRQYGVGPESGLIVDSNTTWAELIPNDPEMYQAVKAYVVFKTQMMFDPPSSSAKSTAIENNIKELEFRLNTTYEIGV